MQNNPQEIFESLNSARQSNSKNIEFWDYFDLYNITYDICDFGGQRLPESVLYCSRQCPSFAETDWNYYKWYECGGGSYRIYDDVLKWHAPISGKFDKHVKYYIIKNTIDFGDISDRPVAPQNLPDVGQTIISAKLSRFASYCLFNQLFVRPDRRYTMDKKHKRLVDGIPNSDMQIFLLAYFMHPNADFDELQNIIKDYGRVSARSANRALEKRFSGVIYNVCANNRDFAEIRNAAKDTIFFEKGRPVTKSNEPPANFYNTGLLHAVNDSLANIMDALNGSHDDSALQCVRYDEDADDYVYDDPVPAPKRKKLRKQDVLTIVKDEFAAQRKKLNEQNLSPEDMFCDTSVKNVKSMLNLNERQFLTYYSKRGLSK
jgi:hypothetical protein